MGLDETVSAIIFIANYSHICAKKCFSKFIFAKHIRTISYRCVRMHMC